MKSHTLAPELCSKLELASIYFGQYTDNIENS